MNSKNSNRFYTIMIVPEKSAKVRRIVLPAWLVRTSALGFAFVTLVGIVMFVDYWYVMNQISENKQLKLENRRLRQQVQVFKNKVTTIESTMDRVKTFVTRLKVITNIEDRGGLLQSLNGKIPEAATNIASTSSPEEVKEAAGAGAKAAASSTAATSGASSIANTGTTSGPSGGATPTALTIPTASEPTAANFDLENPEDALLRREYDELDSRFSDLNRETLYVEQMVQDQYELLADQKAFLAALPTRKPAVGYYTSGFGIRRSPFGGRVKMHEGLDIANHPGTPVKAPADGVVAFANSKSGYGQTLILDHGYGLETWYGHTRKILVSKGQRIKRGDTIALLGNSGRSTGPHVHYEVRVHGTPVDPLAYILEN